VTVNSLATLHAAQKLLDSKKPVQVVPMGVDLQQFHLSPAARKKRQKNLRAKTLTILTVGRLIEVKGTAFLLKALPAIINKHPDTKLVIVGEGPERIHLEELARSLNVISHVTFLGRVPAQKMPKIFVDADIYMGCSITAEDGGVEGLGVVLLEALASELPVIATDTGGMTDIVHHLKTGLLVPEKNSKALGEAFSTIVASNELARNLGKAGRAYVEEKFSWSSVASRFDKLYRDVSYEKNDAQTRLSSL
jgi:phosphatidylinositol alpha-1,6-mannosyltransferase